jgi:hypothetical protein
MKIFKTILLVACFTIMLPTATQAQEDESFIMNLTEFTVKFGHNSVFTEGVKKWNKCYKENGGKDTWNVWHRLQGKGNVYVMASRMNKWAEMDESDPAGKACRSIALDFITPHIESAEYNTARSIPEYSRKTALEGMSIVWVNSFKVKNSMVFNEIVKEVTSVIKSQEGDNRGYWYRQMAGEGVNYFVSTPFKDFADLDNDRDGVWAIFEKAKGKAKTKEIREKFSAVLENSQSYTYTLETDLSMM